MVSLSLPTATNKWSSRWQRARHIVFLIIKAKDNEAKWGKCGLSIHHRLIQFYWRHTYNANNDVCAFLFSIGIHATDILPCQVEWCECSITSLRTSKVGNMWLPRLKDRCHKIHHFMTSSSMSVSIDMVTAYANWNLLGERDDRVHCTYIVEDLPGTTWLSWLPFIRGRDQRRWMMMV